MQIYYLCKLLIFKGLGIKYIIVRYGYTWRQTDTANRHCKARTGHLCNMLIINDLHRAARSVVVRTHIRIVPDKDIRTISRKN